VAPVGVAGRGRPRQSSKCHEMISRPDAKGWTLPFVGRSSGTARDQKQLGTVVSVVFRLYRALTDDRPAADGVAPHIDNPAGDKSDIPCSSPGSGNEAPDRDRWLRSVEP
jgi:hypothetical protein